jgi:hypothetical protein
MASFTSQGASSIIEIAFPGIKTRFDFAAKWHEDHHDIQPHFGQFWNLCVNAAFPDNSDQLPSVSTIPHIDSKNGISVCVVFVYVLPGCEWFGLCFWIKRLKVILQMCSMTL